MCGFNRERWAMRVENRTLESGHAHMRVFLAMSFFGPWVHMARAAAVLTKITKKSKTPAAQQVRTFSQVESGRRKCTRRIFMQNVRGIASFTITNNLPGFS